MSENKKTGQLFLKLQKMAKVGYLVFFEKSIIIINIEKDFVKKLNKDLKKKFKADKVSIFKRTKMQQQYWEDFGEKYLSITVEDVVMENKNSSEIKYDDITKFKWIPFRESVYSSANDQTQDYLGEISIKTNTDKIWFNHRYKKDDKKFDKVQTIKDKLFI